MSNILQLPQLSSATSFAVVTNSQWNDQLSFTQSGWPTPFALAGCALVSGSGNVTCPTTALLVPGQTISPGPGIPVPTVMGTSGLCYVLGVTSPTVFTLGDANGNPLNATATNPGAILTFNPPPLDLTGINFISSVAQANVASPRILITAQTQNNTMILYPKTGVLQYNVPQTTMGQLLPGQYSVDIIGFDGIFTVNLFPQGPATVTVSAGISTTALSALPIPAATPPFAVPPHP